MSSLFFYILKMLVVIDLSAYIAILNGVLSAWLAWPSGLELHVFPYGDICTRYVFPEWFLESFLQQLATLSNLPCGPSTFSSALSTHVYSPIEPSVVPTLEWKARTLTYNLVL